MDRIHRDEIIRSYYRHRLGLGVMGVALPMFLILAAIFGYEPLRVSVSAYFYSDMRDIFVGTMVAISFFLVSYEGYSKDREELISDQWLSTIAGVGALVVALFPTGSLQSTDSYTITQTLFGQRFCEIAHFAGAMAFSVGLFVIAASKFTRTRDRFRRAINRVCAIVMAIGFAISIVAQHLSFFGTEFQIDFVHRHHIVFWSEVIFIWAFGVCWLVKSHAESLIMWPWPRVAWPRDDQDLD